MGSRDCNDPQACLGLEEVQILAVCCVVRVPCDTARYMVNDRYGNCSKRQTRLEHLPVRRGFGVFNSIFVKVAGGAILRGFACAKTLEIVCQNAVEIVLVLPYTLIVGISPCPPASPETLEMQRQAILQLCCPVKLGRHSGLTYTPDAGIEYQI